MLKGLLLAVLVYGTTGCKLSEATAQVKGDDTTLSGKYGATILTCTQTAFTPNSLSTEVELAPLKAITSLTISVPARFDGMTSQDIKELAVIETSGGGSSLKITKALDLYDRAGTLAQVSGGLYGPGPEYAPKYTAKVDLNTQDGGRTGFAAVSIFQGKNAISGTVQLSCARQ